MYLSDEKIAALLPLVGQIPEVRELRLCPAQRMVIRLHMPSGSWLLLSPTIVVVNGDSIGNRAKEMCWFKGATGKKVPMVFSVEVWVPQLYLTSNRRPYHRSGVGPRTYRNFEYDPHGQFLLISCRTSWCDGRLHSAAARAFSSLSIIPVAGDNLLLMVAEQA